MTLDMSQQSPDPEEPETEAERRRANIILLGAAVALVILGVWLVNALVDARKSEECFESGRRNCNPVDVDKNAN
jgi:flagellar biogenesis protein FliO